MARKPDQLAKLSKPGLYGATGRERLFSRLDQLRHHPFIWVCGPPGSGKTTLVVSWIESRRLKNVWYQVDSGDADISTFFYYLGIALRAFAPRKRPLPLLKPEYLQDLHGFVRRYFREMFARMPESGVLVLDNCHEVPNDSAFWDLLHDIASEIPPGRNLVVIGRGKPAAKFAPLLANQLLSSLSWEEIRLTHEETIAIATSRNGVDAGTSTELHERSGGWAAGLILMLSRAKPESAELAMAPLRAGQEIFDYFADQVFDQAPEVARATLLAIALLPTCTAREAESLTGNVGSGPLLESLYRRQMFVDRHDGPEPRYRLHDLFREFLVARSQAIWNRSGSGDLRRRAAGILESNGTLDQAFILYIEAQDWDAACRVILANAQRLLAEGRWRTLGDWISRLPAEAVREQPWLGYWSGLAALQVDQIVSRTTLSGAYDAFESRDDVIGQMLTASAIITGYYFEYVDWKPADVWIERLGGLLQKQPVLPTPELSLFVYSAMLYGVAIRQTNHPMLAVFIDRTLSVLSHEADVNARLQAGMAITGPVACMLGAFSLFREVRERLSPLVRDPRVTEFNRACWHMTCGAKLSFDCEFEEAFGELETAASLAAKHNLRQVEFLSRHFEGLHATCFFDLERATGAFARTRELVDFANPLQRAYHLWGQTAIACAMGKGALALERSREAKEIGDSIGSAAHSIIGSLFLAGSLVLAGRPDEADAVAECALEYGDQQKIPTWEASLLLALAWSHHERGDRVRALDLLAKSIARGKDGSAAYFRWLFLGARKMLAVALQEGVHEQYVQELIRRFRYQADVPHQGNWPWWLRVWTLGSFSIEVDGKPLEYGRKVPKRTLGLLQCLIALGGKDVPEHRLMDELWPDAEGDEAHRRLALTLHRLRHLLGNHETVRLQGGKLSLDLGRVWVDALAFESILADPRNSEAREQAAMLYRGEFLATESEEPWILVARDRFRRLFERSRTNLPVGSPIRNQKETPRPLV